MRTAELLLQWMGQRALLIAAFLVMAAIITHLHLRIMRLEAEHTDLRASHARLLLRSASRLPVDGRRLTDEEFRLVLESLEASEGVDLLNESSVSPSSLWPVNTAVLNRVE